MSKLTYIIISILLLNFFAVFDYDTEIVQPDCCKKTHSYISEIKDTQSYDFEIEEAVLHVNFEFDLKPTCKPVLFKVISTAHLFVNNTSFILFEADASPPLYT